MPTTKTATPPKTDRTMKTSIARGRLLCRSQRARLYGRIHEIIYEEQPYTFLFFRSSFYGFNKRLRGYMFSPRGPFSYGPGVLSIWASNE